MCFAPVKVRWGASDDKELVDTKLLILLSLDMVLLDKDHPHIAANEYDFYFMAREKIIASGAQISFWMPATAKSIRAYKNDDIQERKHRYLNWQMKDLRLTISNPDPNLAYSFGWNDQQMRSLLSSTSDIDPREALNNQLARLIGATNAPKLRIRFEQGDPVLDDDGKAIGHHMVAILDGEIDEGDFFHIYFIIEKAEATQLGRCAGEALLYYYDTDILLRYPNHQFAHDPSVPCALLHFVMLFPTRITNFKPDNFARFKGGKPYAPNEKIFVQDGRWFVVCTPLSRPVGQDFWCSWETNDCLEKRIEEMTRQVKVIKIGDNNTITAPLIIADSIENSFNTLNDAPVDDEVRDLMGELLKTISEVYAKVPSDKSAEAESMARDAETLVKETTSSKPRRQWYELSLQGLKQAAINIGELATPVVNIVAKLIPLLLPAI